MFLDRQGLLRNPIENHTPEKHHYTYPNYPIRYCSSNSSHTHTTHWLGFIGASLVVLMVIIRCGEAVAEKKIGSVKCVVGSERQFCTGRSWHKAENYVNKHFSKTLLGKAFQRSLNRALSFAGGEPYGL